MLFQVWFDGEQYWIESKDFTTAIEVWKKHVAELWGDDYDGSETPDSVTRMSEDAVIRE